MGFMDRPSIVEHGSRALLVAGIAVVAAVPSGRPGGGASGLRAADRARDRRSEHAVEVRMVRVEESVRGVTRKRG